MLQDYTVHPGETLHLEADNDALRIGRLAKGKIRIRIGNEPEFTMGPHGAFQIKPGTACMIQNWLYLDAIVFVTAVSGL